MRKQRLLEIEDFVRWFGSHSGHYYVTKAKTFELDQLRLLRVGLDIAVRWFVEESVDKHESEHFLNYVYGDQNILSSKVDMHQCLIWNKKVQLYLTFLLQKARFISRRNRTDDVYKTYESIYKSIKNGMPYDDLNRKFEGNVLNNYAANGRNFKNMMEQLGFVWWNHGKWMHLTSTGEYLIQNVPDSKVDDLIQEVFEQQAIKWQLSNPNSPERYRHLKLNPFIFILQVLVDPVVRGFLTKYEYALVASRAQDMGDFQEVKKRLLWFRSLDNDDKRVLLGKVRGIIHPDADRPLFEEILDSSSKEMSFLGSTGVISRKHAGGPFQLVLMKPVEARRILKSVGEPQFIKFRNEIDWFSYYGDWQKRPDIDSAIDYYRAIGSKEMLYELGTKLPKGSQQLQEVEIAIKEKDIEDYVVAHLDLIEPGLTLFKSEEGVAGRQFPTEVGPIDCLCKDMSDGFVILELKRDKTSDHTVGQTLRYMGWVKENMETDKIVRGYIVAGGVESKLRFALIGLQYPGGKSPIRVKTLNINIGTYAPTMRVT